MACSYFLHITERIVYDRANYAVQMLFWNSRPLLHCVGERVRIQSWCKIVHKAHGIFLAHVFKFLAAARLFLLWKVQISLCTTTGSLFENQHRKFKVSFFRLGVKRRAVEYFVTGIRSTTENVVYD